MLLRPGGGWAQNSSGRLPAGLFTLGVASGDPLPDGILLWTRVTPTSDAVPGSGLGAEIDPDKLQHYRSDR